MEIFVAVVWGKGAYRCTVLLIGLPILQVPYQAIDRSV